MSLPKETLLRPRYKVIADYPKNNFAIGVILTYDVDSYWLTLDGKPYRNKDWNMCVASAYYMDEELKIQKYPHIFEPLVWYMDRSLKDLPKYIKCINDKGEEYEETVIEKLNGWELDGDYTRPKGWGLTVFPEAYSQPATLEEYTSFINIKNK